MEDRPLVEEARKLLTAAIVLDEHGEPCGTVASTRDAETHYQNVWTRDNVAPMLYFLQQDPGIVRGFLAALSRRQSTDRRTRGLIPIGFSPQFNRTDFGGEESIGGIYSIDSTLWFLILLGLYVEVTEDHQWLVRQQGALRSALDLVLAPRFDPLPLMGAPESVTEIDRPAGLHGYPLQLQVLACLALRWSARLLLALDKGEDAQLCAREADEIASWINRWFWLDRELLRQRAELPSERHGAGNPNPFNLDYRRVRRRASWLGEGGFLAGTLRARHVDTRFWSLPNCLAAVSGVVSESRATAIVRLIAEHQASLMGEMPMAVCWPELRGSSYQIVMDSDPRGRPGVFHNGAHWPNILWAFAPAALKAGQRQLAQDALELAAHGISPTWGEYYDRQGRLGRGARQHQTWSIAGFLLAGRTLEAPHLDRVWPVCLMPRKGW
ncbi:MAG TPA: glycoside hydrolase 100 family protein [Stenomitos sp.]